MFRAVPFIPLPVRLDRRRPDCQSHSTRRAGAIRADRPREAVPVGRQNYLTVQWAADQRP